MIDTSPKDPLDLMSTTRIVPVLTPRDAPSALSIIDALTAGGCPLAEVTLRTSGALDALRRVAVERPDVGVGAGTVVNAEQTLAAIDAGASFIVSPGLSEAVVTTCQSAGIPVLPGVVTPSDIMQALDLGLNVLKFFPAEASGGLPLLTALSAPFRAVRFLPTGGIDSASATRYLRHPQVLAVGGSWMLPATALEQPDTALITALTAQAVAVARSAPRPESTPASGT